MNPTEYVEMMQSDPGDEQVEAIIERNRAEHDRLTEQQKKLARHLAAQRSDESYEQYRERIGVQ